MNIKEIKIKNFKSLYDVSFCPGNINVFIGANGSGKSSVLEAIGVLSAAMTDRVNNNSLQRKGVRLSTSSLYKSQFRSIERSMPTVDFAMSWERNKTSMNILYILLRLQMMIPGNIIRKVFIKTEKMYLDEVIDQAYN